MAIKQNSGSGFMRFHALESEVQTHLRDSGLSFTLGSGVFRASTNQPVSA